MNISKRVTDQLQELAARRSAPEVTASLLAQERSAVTLPIPVTGEEEASITLDLEDHGRYSAAVNQLEVSCKSAIPDGQSALDSLQQWADQITARLVYLEEPLALVELDRNEAVAQLRSHPPQRDDEAISYWEVKVWAEPRPLVRMGRYQWRPTQVERDVLAHPVTFATLGRMAQDLVSILASR